MESMAGNHGFADGNKRTTLILVHTLISKSGYSLVAVEGEVMQEAIEEIILRAASGTVEIGEITEWFRLRLQRR